MEIFIIGKINLLVLSISNSFLYFVNRYYSEELNKDRLDGMSMYNNNPAFTSILIDHTNQSYTVVYYQGIHYSIIFK